MGLIRCIKYIVPASEFNESWRMETKYLEFRDGKWEIQHTMEYDLEFREHVPLQTIVIPNSKYCKICGRIGYSIVVGLDMILDTEINKECCSINIFSNDGNYYTIPFDSIKRDFSVNSEITENLDNWFKNWR